MVVALVMGMAALAVAVAVEPGVQATQVKPRKQIKVLVVEEEVNMGRVEQEALASLF